MHYNVVVKVLIADRRGPGCLRDGVLALWRGKMRDYAFPLQLGIHGMIAKCFPTKLACLRLGTPAQ